MHQIQPLVSIVNNCKYAGLVSQTIENAPNQTCKNIEVVANDGSMDKLWETI